MVPKVCRVWILDSDCTSGSKILPLAPSKQLTLIPPEPGVNFSTSNPAHLPTSPATKHMAWAAKIVAYEPLTGPF